MPHLPASRSHCICAALLLVPVLLRAQTWAPVNDNNWNIAANWSTGAIPTSADTATFGTIFAEPVVDVSAMNVGEIYFTSTATAYTFNLIEQGNTLTGAGIVNDSAFRPIFDVGDNANFRLTGSASLGNAVVNLLGIDTASSVLALASPTASFGHAIVTVGQGGSVTVSGGSVRSDGSGAQFIFAGGSMTVAANATGAAQTLGSIEGTGVLHISSVGIITGQLGTDTTFAGTISGAGPVTKTGAGTLTLTGAVSLSSLVEVDGGALAIAANDRLGTAALQLDGGNLRYTAAFDDLRAVTLGASGGGLDTQAFSVTHSAGIAGTGALTKWGDGTLTLAAANTYSGGTILAAGTLAAGDDAALGTGTLQLAGGTLTASGGARTLANAVTLTADTTLGGAQALTFAGNWTLAKNRDLTVANSAPTTISGSIGEAGGSRGLAKYGAGMLVLTGANTYTGGTLIAEGTVKINNTTGSAFGTGAVTIANGATLTGAGYFSGALQNNGTFSPGNSPVLETLASFNQGEAGRLVMELGGLSRGTGYDALDVTGTLTFGGELDVTLLNGFVPASGETFNLFDWGSASGAFATMNLPNLAPGLSWDTSALYTTGELSVTASAIPEPSMFAALAGVGAFIFVVSRRQLKRTRAARGA